MLGLQGWETAGCSCWAGLGVGFGCVKARLGFVWLWETEHQPRTALLQTPPMLRRVPRCCSPSARPGGTVQAGDTSEVGSSSVRDRRAQSWGAGGAATAGTAAGTRFLLTPHIPNHSLLAAGQQPSLLSLLCSRGAEGPGRAQVPGVHVRG